MSATDPIQQHLEKLTAKVDAMADELAGIRAILGAGAQQLSDDT